MIALNKITCGLSIVFVAVLATNLLPASAGSVGNIEVKFRGLNSSKGQVCANLFNGKKGFPDGGKMSDLKDARCAPIVKGTAQMTFANLPSGDYAISALHDLNGDTVLNSNFFGVPTEGIGFSNNPIVKTSAPSFNQTRFFTAGKKIEISIRMQYFN
jgi:uncharacterized protein (DUF2141 family)